MEIISFSSFSVFHVYIAKLDKGFHLQRDNYLEIVVLIVPSLNASV